jgi:peptidoglycan/LPS O-acetylase OafA/YrhL
MESLTAFLVLAALVMRFFRKDRTAVTLFLLACLLSAVLLRMHANDALQLSF